MKVVVDAYTGQVTFYIVDPDDPIVRTYAKIFPDLFTPEGEIPDPIRAHLRYPEDLFRLQVQVHLTYHIERAEDLYQKNDLWAVPTETFISNEQEVLPYYVIMRLPGESEEEFLLILPVTPAGRRNAIAWIAGRSDGEHLGELVVYQFQAGIQIDGPSQVESRIDQDTVISPQLTLLGQKGSELIRGNLLMIPIEDSIMYVEPVYLQAEINPFPELKRVIAVNGNRIAMEPTLEQALAKVIDATPAVQPAPTDPPPAPTTPEPTPTRTPGGGTEGIAALVREAQEAYDSRPAGAARRRLRWLRCPDTEARAATGSAGRTDIAGGGFPMTGEWHATRGALLPVHRPTPAGEPGEGWRHPRPGRSGPRIPRPVRRYGRQQPRPLPPNDRGRVGNGDDGAGANHTHRAGAAADRYRPSALGKGAG